MIGALAEKVQVGDRVSYEDMANPRRVGIVAEVIDSKWGRQYVVAWEPEYQFPFQGSPSFPGAGERVTGTTSDLRQAGWKWLGES